MTLRIGRSFIFHFNGFGDFYMYAFGREWNKVNDDPLTIAKTSEPIGLGSLGA